MQTINFGIISKTIIVLVLACIILVTISLDLLAQNEQLCSGAGGRLEDGQCVVDGEGDLFDTNRDGNSIFTTIADILLFLVGAISVIMLIIGGIRYAVSGGDQNAVAGAKNTILYAIVGIVVAFVAYAAVNFIVDRLTN